jgi:hypothetical protein
MGCAAARATEVSARSGGCGTAPPRACAPSRVPRGPRAPAAGFPRVRQPFHGWDGLHTCVATARGLPGAAVFRARRSPTPRVQRPPRTSGPTPRTAWTPRAPRALGVSRSSAGDRSLTPRLPQTPAALPPRTARTPARRSPPVRAARASTGARTRRGPGGRGGSRRCPRGNRGGHGTEKPTRSRREPQKPPASTGRRRGARGTPGAGLRAREGAGEIAEEAREPAETSRGAGMRSRRERAMAGAEGVTEAADVDGAPSRRSPPEPPGSLRALPRSLPPPRSP